MRDLQGILYRIREVSTDHLERPAHHKGEEEKLVSELEQITTLADAALDLLRRGGN